MRKVVHLSDMHFGRIDEICIEPLIKIIKKIDPNLVIITGDFTQRARIGEFEEAKGFLEKIPYPYFVIPGNHDIRPLYSPISRIIDPFDRYKKYISENLEPVYVDNEIAVTSIRTVRSHSIKDGRVNRKQIQRASDLFNSLDKDLVKIIATHHPFDMPYVYKTKDKEYVYHKHRLARKAKLAIHTLATVGTDVYLSGHYHQSSVGNTAARYKIDNYSALSVRAGTISIRQRGEVQSFNLLSIEKDSITIDTYYWNPNHEFELITTIKSSRTGSGWTVPEIY